MNYDVLEDGKQDFQMTERRRRSLNDISIFDLRSRIASLKRADLKTLSAEAAAYRIGRVIDQYPFQIRSMGLNGVYRARSNKPGPGFLMGITGMVSTGYSGRATKQAEWNRAGPLLWVKHAERGTSGIAATAWKCLYSSLGRDTQRKG
jgi:hypothetical protein